MGGQKRQVYYTDIRRPDWIKTERYLKTGKVHIFGIGNPAAKTRIDTIVREETPLLEEAFQRWNVDPSEVEMIEPIYVKTLNGHVHTDKKDGITRSSEYNVDIIAFSEKQVFVYSKEWHVLDYSYNVVSHEFYYEDITSVGIVEENEHEVTKNLRILRGPTFDVRSVKFVRLEFLLNGWRFSTSLFNTDTVPLEKIQGAINLIRQKKM